MRDSFDRRLDERLAGLVAATSDSARIERVRARCHAVLVKRVIRAERRRRVWHHVVAPALVGSFCVVYFALMLYGAFFQSFNS